MNVNVCMFLFNLTMALLKRTTVSRDKKIKAEGFKLRRTELDRLAALEAVEKSSQEKRALHTAKLKAHVTEFERAKRIHEKLQDIVA